MELVTCNVVPSCLAHAVCHQKQYNIKGIARRMGLHLVFNNIDSLFLTFLMSHYCTKYNYKSQAFSIILKPFLTFYNKQFLSLPIRI